MNYLAILLATIAQFIIGAIWYMPIFGKLWGKIHGFDSLSPETQKNMMKGMGPLLVVQFIATIITTVVLYVFITHMSVNWNVYALAGFLWIGFIVPTQVGAVVFGNIKPEWVVTKIFIMAGASLLCLEAATTIITMMVK